MKKLTIIYCLLSVFFSFNVKAQETPKPTQVVINTPIATEKPNLKKEVTPEKMQKPKTINKTHSEIFMGKAMKKKLRFGKK